MKRLSSCLEKIETERSSLESYSVVLTSLWPKWLTCLILEDMGFFLCITFLVQFVPTIRSLGPRPCNTKNQCNRDFIQSYLSGTPSHTSPGISWKTRLLGKKQKPQLFCSIGKRERYRIYNFLINKTPGLLDVHQVLYRTQMHFPLLRSFHGFKPHGGFSWASTSSSGLRAL